MRLKIFFALLSAVLIPGILCAQIDTTDMPVELKAGLDRMLRMAEEAQRFYDDSLAPRSGDVVIPIPRYPSWEILTPAAQISSTTLQVKIAGSRAGSLELELPAALCYRRSTGSRAFRLDSLPPPQWTLSGKNSAAYTGRGKGPLKLSCRVDCFGPMINYRLDLENTGSDTLYNIQALVSLAIGKLPALLRPSSRPDSSEPGSLADSILDHLYLYSSGAWTTALSLFQKKAPGKPIVLFFGRKEKEPGLPAGIFAEEPETKPGFRLEGNTVYLLSSNRQMRLDISASPAASFCCRFSPLRLYLNPGRGLLAPGSKTSVGGIITLSPAE